MMVTSINQVSKLVVFHVYFGFCILYTLLLLQLIVYCSILVSQMWNIAVYLPLMIADLVPACEEWECFILLLESTNLCVLCFFIWFIAFLIEMYLSSFCKCYPFAETTLPDPLSIPDYEASILLLYSVPQICDPSIACKYQWKIYFMIVNLCWEQCSLRLASRAISHDKVMCIVLFALEPVNHKC